MKKRLTVILSILILLVVLSGCGGETRSMPANEIVVKSDSTAFVGMNYEAAVEQLRTAGFTNIELEQVEDLTSANKENDGGVEWVEIGGNRQFSSGAVFEPDTKVTVLYHVIPRLQVPVTQSDVSTMHYFDLGEALYRAGFINIKTLEQYDLDAQGDAKAFKNEVLVDNAAWSGSEELPFDAEITVIGHFAIPLYHITLAVDFDSNLLLSRYGVDVRLDGEKLGAMEHGKSTSYELDLPAGSYTVKFASKEKTDVSGQVQIDVIAGASYDIWIKCHSDEVDVKLQGTEYSRDMEAIEMKCSSYAYLRTDATKVETELRSLGFENVTLSPTTETVWDICETNYTVAIQVGGEEGFKAHSVYSKDTPIVIMYRVPDFRFNQDELSVTEQDVFEIPFTIDNPDCIADISFEIDNTDGLKPAKNLQYTAIQEGTATVKAMCGDAVCSVCTITIEKLIIPIESIVIECKEFSLATGSYFDIAYSYHPGDANYTDTKVSISNDSVIRTDDGRYYCAKPGDAEITIYQDDRMLGTCKVHSEIIDIEEIIFDETEKNGLVGRTTEFGFKLLPETASTLGVEVTVSNGAIAEAGIDGRGNTLLNVEGLKQGEVKVTLTAPSGVSATKTIRVDNVVPDEISVGPVEVPECFRVGTKGTMEYSMKPDDVTDTSVVWSSSDKRVIKVSANGDFEAVGLGTAEIIATHKSGVTGKYSVTVEPTPVESVTLTSKWDEETPFIAKNTMQLYAEVLPVDATDKALTWASSDETVATVSSKGVVTAVKDGYVTITATTADGVAGEYDIWVDPTPQKFKISYTASLIDNDSVGNSWLKNLWFEDEIIYSGSVVSVMPGEEFTIWIEIIDNDSIPDYGYYSVKLVCDEDLIENGFTDEDYVYVTESNGRYSHHTAEWRVTISVKAVK